MRRQFNGSGMKRMIALVLVALLAIPCGSAAVFAEDAKAETVYTGGVVYTVEGANWDQAPQQSVAVGSDGKILYVGSDEGAAKYIGDDTEVVDLEGKVMLPGFVDSHVHAPGTALVELYEIYLYESITKEQTLTDIKAYIEANPDLDAYWGNGFTVAIGGDEAGGKGPKMEWLDEICSDKPILLNSNDGHNWWLNSKAMEMNGITKDTTHPTGTVQKDANGELWGTLTDAESLITMEQDYGSAQFKAALGLYQEKMSAWGYTASNTMPYSGVHLDELLAMEKEGALHMRTNLATSFDPEHEFQKDIDNFLALKAKAKDSKLIEVTTGKFFMDGVVEGMTAYLSKPYDEAAGLDPDFVSVPLWDAEKVKEYFDICMKNGIQIHVHSIGDAATSQTVDAMEYAQQKNPTVDARNTITHLQVVKDADKARMGKLGIIGSTQPFWHLKEPEWFEYVDKVALGEERAWVEYPVKSMIDAGVLMTFSGDYPVSPINNPFWAMEASVTRNLNNPDYYGVDDITSVDDPTWLLNPAERISVKQAIEAYTKNVAYQLYKEDEIGTLKAGKYADMIIVDRDPLKISPLDLDKVQVLATIFNGQMVYEAEIQLPFTDVEGHWASEAIGFVYGEGLFGGVSADKFSPDGTMTRGMIVTVLGRYADVDVASVTPSAFTDVPEGQYYAPYVAWAAEKGIVDGVGDGKFAPESPVTREQMAKILAGFIAKSEMQINHTMQAYPAFTDEASIAAWALEPVKQMQQFGIIAGRPEGGFDPQGLIKRAEAATMLMRMDNGKI